VSSDVLYEALRKYVDRVFSPAEISSPKGLHYRKNEFSESLQGGIKQSWQSWA